MKKILIGLFVLIGLGLGAVYYYIQNLDTDALKDRVLAELKNHINADVSVKGVRISGFSRLALDGVEIRMDGRIAFVTELAYMDLNLSDLISQKLTLNAMGMESARFNLFRIGEKWNYEVFLPEHKMEVEKNVLPKLSIEAASTTSKALRVDLIRVRDLKVYEEERHLSDISLTGSLDYPLVKIHEIKVSRGKRTEILSSVHVDLLTKSVTLQFLKNLVDPMDFSEFFPKDVPVPAGDLSFSGKVQVQNEEVSPDFSLQYGGTSLLMGGQKLRVEPFSLQFKDTISGAIQLGADGVLAKIQILVSDYMQGQDKLLVDGSSVDFSLSLPGIVPEASGKVDVSSKLFGGLSSLVLRSQVQSDSLSHPLLTNSLKVLGEFSAKADVTASKFALHGLDVKIAGGQKIARIGGGMGFDGARGYPSGLLMDVNVSGLPGEWIHPAASAFTLQEASLKSGFMASFLVVGNQSQIKGGFQLVLGQEPVVQNLVSSGNLNLLDLLSYMKSQDLPKVEGNLILGLKGPVTGAYLMDVSAQSLSVLVTDTLPPMVFLSLKSQLQVLPKESLFRLASSDFQMFGGQVGVSGFMKSDENKFPNSFQATIKNVDLDALVVYGAPDMHGHISGKMDGVIEDFRLIEPFSEKYPVALKGTLSVRQPVYYYHRGVADMIDSVEEQIRQKHLANLLQKKSDEQRKNVRFSAFEDLASVPFEFTRKRLLIGPAILQEKNREFVGSFAQMAMVLPVTEEEEGHAKGDLHVQIGNAFLRSKFPWLRDDFTQDILASVAVNGPFFQPVAPAEMQRVQQSVTSAVFQALDLSKIKSSVEQGINTIKNLFQGGSSAQPAKQEALQGVQDQVQNKVDQSLRGVEKMLGTTETEALKNKVTDKIFKLFR